MECKCCDNCSVDYENRGSDKTTLLGCFPGRFSLRITQLLSCFKSKRSESELKPSEKMVDVTGSLHGAQTSEKKVFKK